MSKLLLTLLSPLVCVRAIVSHAPTLAGLERMPKQLSSETIGAAYVINREQATDRWFNMRKMPWFKEFGSRSLPPVQRYEAKTPDNEKCFDAPKTIKDCHTKSHKDILLEFASNSSFGKTQWVLIFEDTADLHPSVVPGKLHDIFAESLAEASRKQIGVVYYGLCMPHCEGARVKLESASMFHKCRGFCTHAYAVRKAVAANLPKFIEGTGTATLDVALTAISRKGQVDMSFVGYEFPSPNQQHYASGGQYGIFYSDIDGDYFNIPKQDAAPTQNAPTAEDDVPTQNAPEDAVPTRNKPQDDVPTRNAPQDWPTQNAPQDAWPTRNGP